MACRRRSAGFVKNTPASEGGRCRGGTLHETVAAEGRGAACCATTSRRQKGRDSAGSRHGENLIPHRFVHRNAELEVFRASAQGLFSGKTNGLFWCDGFAIPQRFHNV